MGKGLASSITAALEKMSDDAKRAKEHYGDLKALIFVTPDTVTKKRQEPWITEIRDKYGLQLTVMEREEIIAELMMPNGAIICSNVLGLDTLGLTDFVDTFRKVDTMSRMPESKDRRLRRRFDEDFKAQAVRLALHDGKSVGAFARDLDLTESALRHWVERTRADQTGGRTGLTTAEREELAQLRKENQRGQFMRRR